MLTQRFFTRCKMWILLWFGSLKQLFLKVFKYKVHRLVGVLWQPFSTQTHAGCQNQTSTILCIVIAVLLWWSNDNMQSPPPSSCPTLSPPTSSTNSKFQYLFSLIFDFNVICLHSVVSLFTLTHQFAQQAKTPHGDNVPLFVSTLLCDYLNDLFLFTCALDPIMSLNSIRYLYCTRTTHVHFCKFSHLL